MWNTTCHMKEKYKEYNLICISTHTWLNWKINSTNFQNTSWGGKLSWVRPLSALFSLVLDGATSDWQVSSLWLRAGYFFLWAGVSSYWNENTAYFTGMLPVSLNMTFEALRNTQPIVGSQWMLILITFSEESKLLRVQVLAVLFARFTWLGLVLFYCGKWEVE